MKSDVGKSINQSMEMLLLRDKLLYVERRPTLEDTWVGDEEAVEDQSGEGPFILTAYLRIGTFCGRDGQPL